MQLPLPVGSPSPSPQPSGSPSMQLPLAPGMATPTTSGPSSYRPRPSMGITGYDEKGRPLTERKADRTGLGYVEYTYVYPGGKQRVGTMIEYADMGIPEKMVTKTYTTGPYGPVVASEVETRYQQGVPSYQTTYAGLQEQNRLTTYQTFGAQPQQIQVQTVHDISGRGGFQADKAMRDALNLQQESQAAYKQRSAISEAEYTQAFYGRQLAEFNAWEVETAKNPYVIGITTKGELITSPEVIGQTTKGEFIVNVGPGSAAFLAWEKEMAKNPVNVAVTTKGEIVTLQPTNMSELTVKVPQYKTDKSGNVVFQSDILGVPGAVHEYKEYKVSALTTGFAEFARAYPGKVPVLTSFQSELFVVPENPQSAYGRQLKGTPFEWFYNMQTFFMQKRGEASEFAKTYPSTGTKVLSAAGGLTFGFATVVTSPEFLTMPITTGETTIVKGGQTLLNPELFTVPRSLETIPYIRRVPVVRTLWSGTVQDVMAANLVTQVATSEGRTAIASQFMKDPYYTIGSSAPLIYGIARDVISSFPGRYALNPGKVDVYRQKEFSDYVRLVRIGTREPIELKPELAFERVEGATPETARFVRDFLKQEKEGFIGGSVIHESIAGVRLKRNPQDIEFYTTDRSFWERFTAEASRGGFKVTKEGNALFLEGMKIDVNPAYLGQRNIESVIPKGEDWTKYILKSGEGISIVSPNVLVRRSLVGAFEPGKESNQPMYRYSKDIPRLFSTTEEALSQQRANIEARSLVVDPWQGFLGYRTRIGELILERYRPPEEVEYLTPIKFRGYEEDIQYPKALTELDEAIINKSIKEGGYLGGSAALYFQIPGFREYGDIDIYFQKGPEFTKAFGERIAKQEGLTAVTRSHTLLYEGRGKELGGDVWSHFTTPEAARAISEQGFVLGKKGVFTMGEGNLAENAVFLTKDVGTWGQTSKGKKLAEVKFSVDTGAKILKIRTLQEFMKAGEKYTKDFDLFSVGQDTLRNIMRGAQKKGYAGVELADLYKENWESEKELKEFDVNPFDFVQGGFVMIREGAYNFITGGSGKRDLIVFDKSILKQGPSLVGREIADIAPRLQPEKVRTIHDIPVRDWKLVIKDKRGLIRSVETRERLGKEVSAFEYGKYKKALADVAFAKEHGGKAFPTTYGLKLRFIDVRALDEFTGLFANVKEALAISGRKGQAGISPAGMPSADVGVAKVVGAPLSRAERSVMREAVSNESVSADVFAGISKDYAVARQEPYALAVPYDVGKQYASFYAGQISTPYVSTYVAPSYPVGVSAAYPVSYAGKYPEPYVGKYVSPYPIAYPTTYPTPYQIPYTVPYPYVTPYPTPYPTTYPYPTTVPIPTQVPKPDITPWPSSKEDKKRKKAFHVQIKRRGKYLNIGPELPFGRALEFGTKKTRESIAATFRLKEAGTTELEDIQYIPSTKIFRTYQVRHGQRVDLPLTFIQRRGTRLGTAGEVAEITAAKRSARANKLMFGGLFSV